MSKRPLRRRSIVVTAPGTGAGSLHSRLAFLGADVIHVPTIARVGPESWLELDASLDAVAEGSYDWVVFSSGFGVLSVITRLQARNLEPGEVLARTKVAAVGSKTAAALDERGVDVDLVPERFTADDVASAIGKGSGRVLVPRPEVATDELVANLGEGGWDVDAVIAYRTIPGDPDRKAVARVRKRKFDLVTFTSGSTARFFRDLVGEPEDLGLSPDGDKSVVVIGPSTERVAIDCGFRVDATARPHTIEGVADAVVATVGR